MSGTIDPSKLGRQSINVEGPNVARESNDELAAQAKFRRPEKVNEVDHTADMIVQDIAVALGLQPDTQPDLTRQFDKHRALTAKQPSNNLFQNKYGQIRSDYEADGKQARAQWGDRKEAHMQDIRDNNENRGFLDTIKSGFSSLTDTLHLTKHNTDNKPENQMQDRTPEQQRDQQKIDARDWQKMSRPEDAAIKQADKLLKQQPQSKSAPSTPPTSQKTLQNTMNQDAPHQETWTESIDHKIKDWNKSLISEINRERHWLSEHLTHEPVHDINPDDVDALSTGSRAENDDFPENSPQFASGNLKSVPSNERTGKTVLDVDEQRLMSAKLKAANKLDQAKDWAQEQTDKAKRSVNGAADKLNNKLSEHQAEDKTQQPKAKIDQKADQAKDKLNQAKQNMQNKADQAKDKVNDKADQAKDKAKDKADQVKDKVNDKADQAKDKADQLKDKAKDKGDQATKDKGDQAKDKAKDKADQAKDKADQVKDKADQVKDKVKDKADQVKDKAQDKADQVKDKAQDKADQVKDKASQAKDKASDKVDQAKDKAADKAGTAQDKAEQIKDKAKDKVDQAGDKAKQKGAQLSQKVDDKATSAKGKLQQADDDAKQQSQFDRQLQQSQPRVNGDRPSDHPSMMQVAGERLHTAEDWAKKELHKAEKSLSHMLHHHKPTSANRDEPAKESINQTKDATKGDFQNAVHESDKAQGKPSNPDKFKAAKQWAHDKPDVSSYRSKDRDALPYKSETAKSRYVDRTYSRPDLHYGSQEHANPNAAYGMKHKIPDHDELAEKSKLAYGHFDSHAAPVERTSYLLATKIENPLSHPLADETHLAQQPMRPAARSLSSKLFGDKGRSQTSIPSSSSSSSNLTSKDASTIDHGEDEEYASGNMKMVPSNERDPADYYDHRMAQPEGETLLDQTKGWASQKLDMAKSEVNRDRTWVADKIQGSSDKASQEAKSLTNKAGETLENAKDWTAEKLHDVKDKLSSIVGSSKDKVETKADQAKDWSVEQMEQAKKQLASLTERPRTTPHAAGIRENELDEQTVIVGEQPMPMSATGARMSNAVDSLKDKAAEAKQSTKASLQKAEDWVEDKTDRLKDKLHWSEHESKGFTHQDEFKQAKPLDTPVTALGLGRLPSDYATGKALSEDYDYAHGTMKKQVEIDRHESDFKQARDEQREMPELESFKQEEEGKAYIVL